MINFKTPTKDVINELTTEERKAVFWLKKHYHGEKGYERMRDDMIERCNLTRKDQCSDVVEYISPNGNRWMVFEHCKYHESIHHGYTVPVAFCYYETYGSCGAYVIIHDAVNGKSDGVVMFTDHFFLRFCERLGVQMRSRWMIQRFIEVIPGFTLSFGEKNESGFITVDCRLPASLGRGILRKDGFLVEIRTYLTDKQLNNKQKRDTERIRMMGDKQTYEPLDVKQARLMLSDNFQEDFEKEIFNAADMAGIDKGDMIAATNIQMFIVCSLIDLGYAESDDIPFWQRYSKSVDAEKVLDFIKTYFEKGNTRECAKMLYDIIEHIGSYMCIKKYDPVKVMDKTIEHWKEHNANAMKDHENV